MGDQVLCAVRPAYDLEQDGNIGRLEGRAVDKEEALLLLLDKHKTIIRGN